MDLLNEIAPKVSRVAVLWNPTTPDNALAMRETKLAAARGLELQFLEAMALGLVIPPSRLLRAADAIR